MARTRNVVKTTKIPVVTKKQEEVVNKTVAKAKEQLKSAKTKTEIKKATSQLKAAASKLNKKKSAPKKATTVVSRIIYPFIDRYNKEVGEAVRNSNMVDKLKTKIRTLRSRKAQLKDKNKIKKYNDEIKALQADLKTYQGKVNVNKAILKQLEQDYDAMRKQIKNYITNSSTKKRITSCSTAGRILGKVSAIEGNRDIGKRFLSHKYSIKRLKKEKLTKEVADILERASAAGKKLRSCR